MSVIRIRMPAPDKFRWIRSTPFSPAMLCAGTLLAVCLMVTLFGYFFQPPLKKQKPPHVLFLTNGGPVLFPHQRHSHKDGGAFDCTECHHKLEEDTVTADKMRCRSCHYDNPDIVETVCADGAAHPRCIGRRCNACHEGEACTFCHRKQQP